MTIQLCTQLRDLTEWNGGGFEQGGNSFCNNCIIKLLANVVDLMTVCIQIYFNFVIFPCELKLW
jgi:hypothetical protein